MRKAAWITAALIRPAMSYAQDTVTEPSMAWMVVKMIIALVLIVVVMIISARLLRNRIPGGQGANLPIDLLGSRPLGPKRMLQVVRIKDKVLLIGVTDQSINLLTELPAQDYENVQATPGFRQTLSGALKRSRGEEA